jgi:hypothetical protein
MTFHVTELCRITTGPMTSSSSDGNNGAFDFESPESGWRLAVIASDGHSWEHVSVHAYQGRNGRKQRVPNWREMCYVKRLFWDDDDTVIQFHPRRSEYVNTHPNVLHLWRPTREKIPEPPSWMVGMKEGESYEEVMARVSAAEVEAKP